MKHVKRDETNYEGAARVTAATTISQHPNDISVAANAGCSKSKSSVPRKILKFARAPHKYVYENCLIGALFEEPDNMRRRVWYEMTFGEPACTFLHDKRMKIVIGVVCYASELRQKKFFAHCINELRQSHVENHWPVTTTACSATVDRTGDRNAREWPYQESLNDLQLEITEVDLRLRELLRELKEQDPMIARAAEKFAFDP